MTALSIKKINLLEAQNEGLKKQNKELQEEIKKYAAINEQETKDYAELKAENERLKEEIKEIKKYQYEQEYLDKEIEEMQKALKTLAEGLNIRQQTLQEIKAIATTDCGYCKNFRCPRMDSILDLITKAEEE